MLKIIGLLSVFLSVPLLGGTGASKFRLPEDDGASIATSVATPAPPAVELGDESHYISEETLAIAHEIIAGIPGFCACCDGNLAAAILRKHPKTMVDQFKSHVLDIKGAIHPEQEARSEIVSTFMAVIDLGGLPAVEQAMTKFREEREKSTSFSTSSEAHAAIIQQFEDIIDECRSKLTGP